MIKAIFFDMNETLLDLNKLQVKFDKYFNDRYVMKYWFVKLLHTSTVIGSIGDYENFGELARVVLKSVFRESHVALTKEIEEDILGTFRKLDVYDDVPTALKLLNENDIKVIPVSNSSLEMMKMQLSNSGILSLVDCFYSVDSVEKYKPFSNIYEYVAGKENLQVDEIYMVATHDWDLFGAQKVGLKTAYIERKPGVYNPYYSKPDHYEKNLIDLVKIIINENVRLLSDDVK
ncbi:2-haloacid dehalogenase [Halolactibacillus halophilus]|uniref:Haloacid dehalogenase n=1 Tax=Halolactibacillus halophilus TaxID=306540 RepID=A0A1I5SWM9_9BACI|nr:haloacid dehalogenase type II [Halolactibacillus halophilus]GEM02741.1 haloacid dehalogenase [Halolactibacillus halophilus]SFP75118.1 2-haloacid dehalogenase [Halolactibacillus halophilus]